MFERVNGIRDGRASFREEMLVKDLSCRAGELESSRLSFKQFYTFSPKTVGPLEVPQRVGDIVDVMRELESSLYGRPLT